MKKIWFLPILLVVLIQGVSATYTCNDSDNTSGDALNSYKVWGYAHKYFTVFDYCKNGPGTDTLREAYCNGNVVAYQDVSCSTTFGSDYKCIFGKCTKFVWCRFDEQNPNICDSLPAEKRDKCIEALNQHECERLIPEDICTWVGGTAYESQEQCQGDPQVPEFSRIAAGLALAGAATGFILLRKRRS